MACKVNIDDYDGYFYMSCVMIFVFNHLILLSIICLHHLNEVIWMKCLSPTHNLVQAGMGVWEQFPIVQYTFSFHFTSAIDINLPQVFFISFLLD